MMDKFLFDEFRSVSAREWKQKIQVELKGADYNSTLLSHTNEGISIKPFYHQDTFRQIDVPNNPEVFLICQSVFVNDEKKANFLAIDALKRGANVIKFTARKAFDFELLLKNLNKSAYQNLQIHFELQFLELDFISALIDFIKDEKVYLNIDLIGNLVKHGHWFDNRQKDHEQLRAIIKKAPKNIGVLGVDVSHYQNSGAGIVQQVAYALAHANEYLNELFKAYQSKELQLEQIENIVKNMQFSFAVGGHYFFEIAKFRAFRSLWRSLLEVYALKADANIYASPSLRNKSIYDVHVNMLRTTTECMSAIMGGANTIANVAYDAIFHKKHEFGERIARNQLIILKEESGLKQTDFSKGAYYIEDITTEISEKALALFKDIEKSGGFVRQLFEGTIQRKIHESAQKEQQQFDSGELVLLGANKYPNKADRMNDALELYPFVRTKKRQTTIKPIIAKRLAEGAEQKRLANEADENKNG